MKKEATIEIIGAQMHNLKNVDVQIPASCDKGDDITPEPVNEEEVITRENLHFPGETTRLRAIKICVFAFLEAICFWV